MRWSRMRQTSPHVLLRFMYSQRKQTLFVVSSLWRATCSISVSCTLPTSTVEASRARSFTSGSLGFRSLLSLFLRVKGSLRQVPCAHGLILRPVGCANGCTTRALRDMGRGVFNISSDLFSCNDLSHSLASEDTPEPFHTMPLPPGIAIKKPQPNGYA